MTVEQTTRYGAAGLGVIGILGVAMTWLVGAALAGDVIADKVIVNDTLSVGGSNATWNVTNAVMGHWHLDDNTNTTTVVDSSGRSHPGAFTGGNTDAHHASGHIGTGALAFDGANDYILVPDHADFDFGTNSFSISAWIYPTDMTDMNDIVDKTSWDSGLPQFYLAVGGGHFQFLTYYDGGYSYVDSLGTISTGAWAHVVAVRNSDGRHQIYINGQLDVEATLTPRNVSNTASLAIGCQSRNQEWRFHGQIDEVAVFSKALSAAEVRGLYADGLGTAQLTGTQYGIVKGEVVFEGNTTRIKGNLRIDQGVIYSKPLGDVSMGSFTNRP